MCSSDNISVGPWLLCLHGYGVSSYSSSPWQPVIFAFRQLQMKARLSRAHPAHLRTSWPLSLFILRVWGDMHLWHFLTSLPPLLWLQERWKNWLKKWKQEGSQADSPVGKLRPLYKLRAHFCTSAQEASYNILLLFDVICMREKESAPALVTPTWSSDWQKPTLHTDGPSRLPATESVRNTS